MMFDAPKGTVTAMPRDHVVADKTLLIATKALTRAYDKLIVVDRVNLRVHGGEIFALIGPNGAGKSTLIKMLTTLLPPTSGDASIAGADLKREPTKVRQRIGYVPQLPSADGALTARENLKLSARLYLIPPAEREQRIEDALVRTKLTDHADRPAQTLSGGMARNLEIACSTLHHPALLIMDEPTTGLDPVARDQVWRHIRQLRDQYGTSILITTHFMDEAGALADRIGIMHGGKLERVGTPDDLRHELGVHATLDDVFAHVAGEDLSSSPPRKAQPSHGRAQPPGKAKSHG